MASFCASRSPQATVAVHVCASRQLYRSVLAVHDYALYMLEYTTCARFETAIDQRTHARQPCARLAGQARMRLREKRGSA